MISGNVEDGDEWCLLWRWISNLLGDFRRCSGMAAKWREMVSDYDCLLDDERLGRIWQVGDYRFDDWWRLSKMTLVTILVDGVGWFGIIPWYSANLQNPGQKRGCSTHLPNRGQGFLLNILSSNHTRNEKILCIWVALESIP